ncbi:MAG: phosphatidate cytidylyltransferase, partial [Clostridia bacterium]|nr:phosphatidate cytidylyltransferase [Clostridia bacterium]
FTYINAYSRIFPQVDDYFSLIILTLIFGCASLTDVMAYLVGSLVKGKKLCPSISPNKTISGAIGGLVGGTACALIVYYAFQGFGYDLFSYLSPKIFGSATPFLKGLMVAVIGLVFAIVGEVGDLAESLIKRQLGVKDMGNLLPGHGGMLDRFDSTVFISLLAHILFSFLIIR